MHLHRLNHDLLGLFCLCRCGNWGSWSAKDGKTRTEEADSSTFRWLSPKLLLFCLIRTKATSSFDLFHLEMCDLPKMSYACAMYKWHQWAVYFTICTKEQAKGIDALCPCPRHRTQWDSYSICRPQCPLHVQLTRRANWQDMKARL